jgi:phage gp29-like protein
VAVEVVLTRAVAQLPTLTFPGWDDFGQISRTITDLERGVFRQAAIMADQMWRDDRFAAVMRKRLDALESVPLVVKPADARATARRIAEELGGLDDVPGKWEERFPSPVLEDLNKWGILMGIAVGENVWRTDDEETAPDVAPGTKYSNGKRLRWTARIKVWDPQWLRWDWSLFRYRLMTAEGEIALPDIGADPRSDGKWIVWCPYGYDQAWKKGFVRSLARLITKRQWTDRDWARYNEKNGNVIVKAIVPTEAASEAKDKYFDSVANINGETAVMVEQSGDETKGKFDIEFVEATARTWQTFESSKKDVNNEISIALLGQNLTTEVKDGKGSLGAGSHENVERNILRKDAGIATCMRFQNLTWDAQHNYNDPTLAPFPIWEVDPPEDEAAKADALNKLGAGLSQLKNAGAPVDDRAVLEQASVPTITVEEQAAREAVAREEAAAQAAAAAGAPNAAGNGSGEGGGAGPGRGAGAGAGGGDARMAAKPIVKRVQFAGMTIAVENPRGSTRYWRDHGPDGHVTGSTQMQNDYGYIEAVLDGAGRVLKQSPIGNDDEEVDVYLGPDQDAANVHIVHQLRAPDFKVYDEDKVMLGFSSSDAALAAYAAHRNDGTRAVRGMSVTPLDVFKAKLRRRTGTGAIRASSAGAIAAIGKLATRAQKELALAARAPTPKKLAYADALIRKAAALGARSLAVDVAHMQHELRAATGFKDLERRLTAAFADMDAGRLAAAVKKSRIMADLAGRLSVHKEGARGRSKP